MRRFWLLIGAAAGSWGCGQAVWTWYESVLGRDVPVPVAGRRRLPRHAAAGDRRAAVAAARRPDPGGPGPDDPGRAHRRGLPAGRAAGCWSSSPSSAPAATVSCQAGDLARLSRRRHRAHHHRHLHALQVRHHRRVAVRLPAAGGTGLVAFAVADSGFSYLTTIDAYSSGNGIDIGWFLGYAADRRCCRCVRSRRPTTGSRRASGWPHVPPAPSSPRPPSLLALLTTAAARSSAPATPTLFVSWVRTVDHGAPASLRQMLTLRENRYLTQHLEQRVERAHRRARRKPGAVRGPGAAQLRRGHRRRRRRPHPVPERLVGRGCSACRRASSKARRCAT